MESFIFLGMNLNMWIVLLTILVVFGLMLFTKLPGDYVFMGSLVVFAVTGVLPVKDALSSFGSESVVMTGTLFVIIAGLVYSGVLQWIVKYCLGTPKTYSKALIRLMLPVSMMSSVLSNTTVVALFLKAVQMWAKRLNIAPSKLLIPLSYASGLGGILTLIGSPTNLVIAGFYADDTGQSLGLFTPTVVGLLCLAVGILSMLALSRLLPVRKSQEDALENVSDYTVELMVPTECPHVGKTVEEAGLYNVEGGHIIEIIRFDHEIISPVSKDEFIFGGDRLIFSGDVARILELKKTHQLVNATHHVFSLKEVEGNRRLQMANVKFTSSLVGKRMRDTDFEESNDVVVVAVAREGERIQDSPREVVLEKGDTLLLECSPSFLKRQEGYVSDLQLFDSEKVPNIGSKTVLSALIMLAMILLSSFNVLPLMSSCFLAAFAMIITHCCSIKQARDSIDWSILMIFAGSVCMGMAIERVGLAKLLADNLLALAGNSPFWVLTCICVCGVVLSEFVSNTAAAAILYPVAYETALVMDVNPLTFCIGLLISVSLCFASPIGSRLPVLGLHAHRYLHEYHNADSDAGIHSAGIPVLEFQSGNHRLVHSCFIMRKALMAAGKPM